MRVGDFGAGEGMYSHALAERVGDGAVYAFEIFPGHIDTMHRAILMDARRTRTVYPLMADLDEHIPLRDAYLNAALVINTLHALDREGNFVHELHRVLDHGAQVLVVDWIASFKNMGPPKDTVLLPGEAVRLFGAHGFTPGTMLPAGSHHYAFIATKQ